jgi:AraC-like DNA-binding protein
MAVVAGGAVKLPAEYPREGLLRGRWGIIFVSAACCWRRRRCEPPSGRSLISLWIWAGSQRLRRQQQAALTNIIPQRLMHHGAEHPLQVPLGYSKWYLQRMFRTVMHQTLGDYIRQRRLLLAAEAFSRRNTREKVCCET